MSNRIIVLQPDDDEGVAWVGAGDLGDYRQRQPAAKARGRTTPGSIYYPSAPPDQDDPWEWCRICACGHPHGPCF